MKLVVLAVATDRAAETEYEEITRFERLCEDLALIGVRIEVSLNLLGRYDYLFVMDMKDDHELAFRAMSVIAQSGTMRTESFVAMPLANYLRTAAEVAVNAH